MGLECPAGAGTTALPSGFLASISTNPCPPFLRAGALKRLATMQHPTHLAERDPRPNGSPGKHRCTLATTRPLHHREDPHSSGARALAAIRDQRLTRNTRPVNAPTHRDSSRTARSLCRCLISATPPRFTSGVKIT